MIFSRSMVAALILVVVLCHNGISLPCVRLNQLTENLHITVGETVTLARYSEIIVHDTIDHPKKAHILPESILVKSLNHISLMDGLLVA